jgi:hypothetical protein
MRVSTSRPRGSTFSLGGFRLSTVHPWFRLSTVPRLPRPRLHLRFRIGIADILIKLRDEPSFLGGNFIILGLKFLELLTASLGIKQQLDSLRIECSRLLNVSLLYCLKNVSKALCLCFRKIGAVFKWFAPKI